MVSRRHPTGLLPAYDKESTDYGILLRNNHLILTEWMDVMR